MRTRSLTLALLSALALCCALPAPLLARPGGQAQNATVLDEIIVTARGMASSLSNTPGGVGVASERDVLLEPKGSLAFAAARIPGVFHGGDSPWGQAINIRGLSGSSVVFLIDGKRVNTATEINAQMGFVQPRDVERIEVLKGAVSALYGSGSLGGVVNVITKKGSFSREPGLTGEVSQGFSTNTEGVDSYGRAAYESENLWVQLSGGLRDHDDYRGGDATTMTNSGYADNQGRLAAGLRWGPGLTTEFQALALEANEVGIPGGSASMPATAPVTYPRTGNVMLSLDTTWDVDAGWLRTLELDTYYMKNDRRTRIEKPNAMVRELRPVASHETMGAKLQAVATPGAHTLVAGADAWRWRMTSDRTYFRTNGTIAHDDPTPNATMTSLGVFAEDDWALHPDWTLNLGLRLDRIGLDNEDSTARTEDSRTNTGSIAHAGLTWRFAPGWSHSLLAAASYRAPDIMERFKSINLGGGVMLLGNPDLAPEKSRSLEYSLHYADGRFSASANAFANWVDDLITETYVSPTRYTMKNLGKARILGAEAQGEWRLTPRHTLYGNVAWLTGKDTNADEPLRNIAPLSGLFGLRYDRGNGFWALGEIRCAADKKNGPDDVQDLPGWGTANLAAGYGADSGSLRHEVSLHLRNLLDRRYVNPLANSRGMTVLEPGFNAEVLYTLSF